jgi:hypothetical protein
MGRLDAFYEKHFYLSAALAADVEPAEACLDPWTFQHCWRRNVLGARSFLAARGAGHAAFSDRGRA